MSLYLTFILYILNFYSGPSMSSIDSFYHRWSFLISDSHTDAIKFLLPKVSLIDPQFINKISTFGSPRSDKADNGRFCNWFHNANNNSTMLLSMEPFNIALLPDYIAVVDCGDCIIVRPGISIKIIKRESR